MAKKNQSFLQWFFCGCEQSVITKEKIVYREKVVKKAAAKPKKNDDLTKIEGIGPVIQKHLRSKDIRSFDDLANAKTSVLREILEKNKLQYHDPTTWPKQSAMARDGKWAALRKWQDELDGGKK